MDHPVHTRVGIIHRVPTRKKGHVCASVSGKRIPISLHLYVERKMCYYYYYYCYSAPVRRKKNNESGSHDVVKLFGRVGVTVMAGKAGGGRIAGALTTARGRQQLLVNRRRPPPQSRASVGQTHIGHGRPAADTSTTI